MPRFDNVIGQPPPYALATPHFRFRALAAFAGRASIGGDREIAMACLVAGRLAATMLPPFHISQSDAKTRSAAAKQWMASLSLPAPVRTPLTEVADAVSTGNSAAVGSAIEKLLTAVTGKIDEASAAELRSLAADVEPAV
ncbi:MAG TPA: hypothetical protein VM099_08200 [Gemmatimonadaceae bacterium]|nr:hypothetical protein [Gemmatimonadaceae bacterium]